MKSFCLTINAESTFQKLKSERVEVATWQQVETSLRLLRSPNQGSVTVTLRPNTLSGPTSLQVFAEGDAFYLMLSENIDEDGEIDHNVRTFYNADGSAEKKIEIGGYEWPEIQTCFDFNIVLGFFAEFCQKGDVEDVRLS